MTETKHTALPWVADIDGYYGVKPRIYGADGSLIAEVGNCLADEGAQHDANADLIVTAVNERPALLAVRDAAKAFLDALDASVMSPNREEDFEEWAKAGRALKTARIAMNTALKQAGAE